MHIILFIAGLIFLVVGAELLVKGSSNIATLFKIPSLVVGLTIVAFGTSAPELAVSLQSALAGNSDISLGNVVGSNIFNVLFILGVSAIITPLLVSRQLIKLDVPIMIGSSVLVLIMAFDGIFSLIDGMIMFVIFLAYTVFMIRTARKEDKIKKADVQQDLLQDSKVESGKWWLYGIFIIAGLGLLVIGSNWLVDGAITIAKIFGLSDLVIGATIVAAGTSLPEVATSVIASIRRQQDIAVGNVVGSNIFNILAVLGLSGIFSPSGIIVADAALRFDIPVMIAVAIACLPIFFTGNLISRWEGILFLGYYVAFTVYLVLASTHHSGVQLFGAAMKFFIIPLTSITLVVVSWRAYRNRKLQKE
jgi:cation:H+ antiporter